MLLNKFIISTNNFIENSYIHHLSSKINYLSNSICYTGIGTVTCLWQPASADKQQQCQFTLALAVNGQEIENQFITNTPIYTRTIQYLGGDIAQDAYLHLTGQQDSVAANSATYLRQYSTTGHSTVLLTFPVAERLLRKGCRLTFRRRQLDLRTRQFEVVE